MAHQCTATSASKLVLVFAVAVGVLLGVYKKTPLRGSSLFTLQATTQPRTIHSTFHIRQSGANYNRDSGNAWVPTDRQRRQPVVLRTHPDLPERDPGSSPIFWDQLFFPVAAFVGAAITTALFTLHRGGPRTPSTYMMASVSAEGEAESSSSGTPFKPVFQGENVVYERSDEDVLLLSWNKGTKDWLGFANPTMPLEFGQEHFRGQVLATLCTGPHDRVLVLGLGLGALPSTVRTIDRKTYVDVVEIDPDIIQGTTTLLPLEQEDHLNIIQGDAVEFVKRPDRKGYYDFIAVDCFDYNGTPKAVLTEEFYKDVMQCLKPKGFLSANLLRTEGESDKVREFLASNLVTPRFVSCKTTPNYVIFGAATPEGEEGVSERELMLAATDLDASSLLPFSLIPLAEAMRPLSEWSLPASDN